MTIRETANSILQNRKERVKLFLDNYEKFPGEDPSEQLKKTIEDGKKFVENVPEEDWHYQVLCNAFGALCTLDTKEALWNEIELRSAVMTVIECAVDCWIIDEFGIDPHSF